MEVAGDEKCGHAEVEGRGDVAGQAVADEDSLLRDYADLCQLRREADRTLREAKQSEKLVATRDALVDSWITSEHARILGTAVQSGALDKAKMLAAAETQAPEQLRKTVRDHQNELAGDVGAKRFDCQREARTASFSLRDDGMWQLFDPAAAARIRKVLLLGAKATTLNFAKTASTPTSLVKRWMRCTQGPGSRCRGMQCSTGELDRQHQSIRHSQGNR